MAVCGPVLVVGGYGYRNVGDEAILAGVLIDLRETAVTVVSRTPAETAALHGVAAISIGAALQALAHHRTLLIGGGGLFSRDMGVLGHLLPAYGLLAARLKRKVLIRGVGVDADLPRVTAALVRWLGASADQIVVRDAASLGVLRELGLHAGIEPDFSERMPEVPRAVGASVLRQTGVDATKPVVGLCLTAMRPRFAEALMDAIPEVANRLPDVELCLIPMSQHPFVHGHNDLLLARAITKAAPRVRILEGSHHPSVILSVFASLTAAVCMRYHSLLFAERSRIPVIAIPYAAKCESWLAERSMHGIEPTAEALTRSITGTLELAGGAS